MGLAEEAEAEEEGWPLPPPPPPGTVSVSASVAASAPALPPAAGRSGNGAESEAMLRVTIRDPALLAVALIKKYKKMIQLCYTPSHKRCFRF